MNTTARLAVSVLALAAALPCAAQDAVKKVPVNPAKTIWLEVLPDGSRRVLVDTEVIFREGPLELLLCRKQTKEHEAVLFGDFDARDIHKALVACGAEPGQPVQFQPQFRPASGTEIRVSLRYQKGGKTVTEPANTWVRHARTKKELHHPWVFAGSRLLPDPEDPAKPPFYTANSGDVICVANFSDAMLDLPVDSPKDNSDLSWEANTPRIPEKETKVTVVLEPVLKK